MRTASSLALLAILGAGCHTMIGHDPSRDSAPAVPDARAESRPGIDLASSRDTPTMHDQSPTDAPADLPQPQPDVTPLDLMLPDLQPDQKPDTLPSFSTTSCQKLWLDSPVVQLSTKGGGRPAIVTVDKDFYVVYGGSKSVHLHRLTPTADLGATVIGSSNTLAPTVAVTLATSASNPQLGVVWENAAGPAVPCPSNLLFATVNVPISAGTSPPASTPVTGSSCNQHGYSNPSLVHTGTQYGLSTVAQYACMPAHYKALAHAFNPTAITPASGCYNGAADTYATVAHKISGARYAAAHLYRSTTAGSPFMITLFRNTGMTGWNLWEGISNTGAGTLPVGLTLPGTSLTEHRPAITSLSDANNDTVHLAWMASDEKLRVHSCAWPTMLAPLACAGPPTTFLPTNASSTASKYSHPALAASPAHGNLLLLAYALDSKEIGISKLAESSGISSSPVQLLVPRSAVPRYTALAAHPEGFGLVWVETVNGTDEVFFKWIGCLP